MPSRVERTRVALEWAARAIGLIALLVLFWSATRPSQPAAAESFAGDGLEGALARWTLERPGDSLHLTLAVAPDAVERDWLRALARAGVGVSWRAPAVPAIAIAAEPVADPRRRARILVAAPSRAPVEIRDEVGAIDSASGPGQGVSVIAPTTGRASAVLGPHSATAHLADSIILKRVLVLGGANWESRFVLAALEESGWMVDARLAVAPGTFVRHGSAAPPDTARYSVVVVLDSTAASLAPVLARFVRSGGGVVLAGRSARLPALAGIAPGGVGERWEPTVRLTSGAASRATLGYYPVQRLREAAVALGRHDGGIAVAAHRVGAGRVVQVGYDETWRLRMTGGDEGPQEHRAWWGGLVSAAAFAPLASQAAPSLPEMGDAAPLASLVAVMGPPRSAAFTATASRGRPAWLEPMLFAIAMLGFLGEWASRRIRGAA